jgi:hypothetical protein
VAKGIEFTCDERIKGQVEACRKFLAVYKPEIVEVETHLFSRDFQYAGTPDLIARMDGGKLCVVDYKASLTKAVSLQLGGYAELIAWPSTQKIYGLGVELHDNGTFKVNDTMPELKQARREFINLRGTFGILERLGKLPKEEAA